MAAADNSLDLGADVVELAPYVPLPATAQPLREVAYRKDAWTSTEVDQLRALFAADEPMAAIAEALGRGLAGTRDKVCSLGLRRNSARPWTELEDAEMARRYGTENTAGLAQELGRSPRAVYAHASILGLTEPSPGPYTEWEKLQVRTGYAAGIPAHQVAILIGRTLAGVNSWASDNGVRHARAPNIWSDAESWRALELAVDGMRYRDIREQLVAEGFPRRAKGPFGIAIRAMGYGRGWGRAWTPDEDELLRRVYADGASRRPLEDRLGRSAGSITHRARHLQLVHPKPNGFIQGPIWSAEDRARLTAEYGKRRPAEIAADLGRPIRAIYVQAHHLGLVDRARFTDEERRAMRIAAEHEVRLTDLAAALGRTSSAINKTVRKMGLSFEDTRRLRTHRPGLTVPQILAMETTDVA